MDQLKDDIRKEFATKLDLDKFESRIADLEEDLDQTNLSIEIDQKKIKELMERVDGH